MMTPDDTGVSSDWGFCLVFSCEYLLLRQTRVQGWCGCDGVPLGCQQCPVSVPVPGAKRPPVAGGIWHIREHPMDPAGLCARTEVGGGAWCGCACWSCAVCSSIAWWVYVDHLFCTSNLCFSLYELYLKAAKYTLIIWVLAFV